MTVVVAVRAIALAFRRQHPAQMETRVVVEWRVIDRFVEHVTLVTHELQKHTSGDVRKENVTVNFEGTLDEKSLASSTILTHTHTCVGSRVFAIS